MNDIPGQKRQPATSPPIHVSMPLATVRGNQCREHWHLSLAGRPRPVRVGVC